MNKRKESKEIKEKHLSNCCQIDSRKDGWTLQQKTNNNNNNNNKEAVTKAKNRASLKDKRQVN
jgi:hypothetical protein